MRRGAKTCVTAVLALLVACSGSGPTTVATPSSEVRAEEVAEVEQPLAMATRSGDDAIYIASKTGTVWALRDGVVGSEPVLDVSERVSDGSEQGLLGLAFSPDGAFVYVDFTDLDGNTNVVEYAWVDDVADVSTERTLLFVEQPFENHNGGNLVFGPDGHLYVGLGDGGSALDPMGNAQNLGVLLGKILRIQPRMPDGSLPPRGEAYAIPDDNPFVGQPGARPEIWAFGLRNPWRFSFDRRTGDLWIGDVGQGDLEEIDFQPADSPGGENYGWVFLEGTQRLVGEPPPGTIPPIFEYAQAVENGCAVTGGYVYRGTALPDLQGWYLFADFCLGDVTAFSSEGGRTVIQPLTTLGEVASFGEDQQGELYVLSLAGGVYKLVP
ncbi:MAG: PQQ-dependent sugar dehydrogenase [Actinomycetota bacterium]